MKVDRARHDVADLMQLVQDQMRDLQDIQQQQTALTTTARAADGTIEVTVDARGALCDILIDETYLDDNTIGELAGYIVGAAREAIQEVERRVAALVEPLVQRRRTIRSLAGTEMDMPDFAHLRSGLQAVTSQLTVGRGGADGKDDDGETDNVPLFPTVKG